METTVKPEWFAKLESWTIQVSEDEFQEFSIPEGCLRIRKMSISGDGKRVFIVELIEQGEEKPHDQFRLDATGVFSASFYFPPLIPYPPANAEDSAGINDEQRRELAERRAQLIVEFIEQRLGSTGEQLGTGGESWQLNT